jgi:hypothetical protein
MKRYKAVNRLSTAFAIIGMTALANTANASTMADASMSTSAAGTLNLASASALGGTDHGSAITANTVLGLPTYTGAQLLSTNDMLSTAGNAYLMFADALAQPQSGRQTAIARQLVSYSVSFGPPVIPVAVPLPPALWLLISGIGGLSAFGSRRRAALSV